MGPAQTQLSLANIWQYAQLLLNNTLPAVFLPACVLQECLEDHIEKSGFSSTCKTTLEDVIAQRVADFRLDAGLQVRHHAMSCRVNLLVVYVIPSSRTPLPSGAVCLCPLL